MLIYLKEQLSLNCKRMHNKYLEVLLRKIVAVTIAMCIEYHIRHVEGHTHTPALQILNFSYYMLMYQHLFTYRVYQEWEIVNNTFVAMVMREGEKCGSNFRTVTVSVS